MKDERLEDDQVEWWSKLARFLADLGNDSPKCPDAALHFSIKSPACDKGRTKARKLRAIYPIVAAPNKRLKGYYRSFDKIAPSISSIPAGADPNADATAENPDFCMSFARSLHSHNTTILDRSYQLNSLSSSAWCLCRLVQRFDEMQEEPAERALSDCRY